MDNLQYKKELIQKSSLTNYLKGNIKSKQYTKEEIEEKRRYFESQKPANVTEKRWLYEIKRIFELSKNFSIYPDWGFSRLEYILKLGYL